MLQSVITAVSVGTEFSTAS